MGLILGLAALYVLVLGVLWSFQERITFPGPRSELPDPAAVLGSGERIVVRMKDGTQLVGWYLPPQHAAARPPALLWFYGNGETIGDIWPVIRDFRPPQAALLVLDYPGYGGSEGRASEAGVYEAAELAYQALRARPDVDSRRIYVYGRSVGSAPATAVAARHDVAGLILESPFTSARDMARRHYRLVPRFLVRLRLDNVAAMARVRCPVLVFHGTDDVIVPIRMGRDVAAAAPGEVEFVMIEGSGHNDTYVVGGAAYREKLWSFVK
jgi:fermentation-respiration switch protein FrsA (DUF1100 family)